MFIRRNQTYSCDVYSIFLESFIYKKNLSIQMLGLGLIYWEKFRKLRSI